MKSLNVQEAQPRLEELIAEACRGELIVLTDGERRVALEPRIPIDLAEDSPELEAELLKAIDGPFAVYSTEEMRVIGAKRVDKKTGQ